MNKKEVYRSYSGFLKEEFGEKIYKIPINLPLTCPNRDGNISHGGCTFCGEEGGSFESLCDSLSVKEQMDKNIEYIGKRYKAKKFIAYFQNFTNTYLELESFKKYIKESIRDEIVGISISTRPDCINDDYLEFLNKIKIEYNLSITIELGLQTVNYHTLIKINRGHGLSEFIDAVLRIKKYGLRICTHLILNLPWDNMIDTIENAKILSSLGIDEIKLHALYIVKGTLIGNQYERGEFTMITKDEYEKRVIRFLEYLDPEIVVQRIIGRAPKENGLFVNWDTSWWKIRDEIVETMKKNNSYQGKKFNYLNGTALKKYQNS
ncbi:TIGR01212 family radical SAM protein [Tissierella creatinophila]|uniref:Coproporphyrinogen III oxidase n=1 Tax=Tissierella creatinophila DSM 6911 TaxID=1123403 RepID=A0A1U7M6A2_TISCR|nr:TIGR01212 family radical SAM protein [Tissierella creatinophila]OLS02805.1 coproporphyrinogen III oxidase [Tissierella creatinophila DSM 6911]